MGINELLRSIEMEEVYIEDLEKSSICIDMSCFIHKAKYANGCSLAYDSDSIDFVYLIAKYFAYFIKHFQQIYFVFDGRTPSIKLNEHLARRVTFDEKKKLGKRLLKSKNSIDQSKGKQMIVQTIETRELVYKICDYFKDYPNIILLSANFEADSLLANLNKRCNVKYLMTEDSDLIAHGCENILYKFNYSQNTCKLYTSDCLINDYFKLREFPLYKEFCVMCGCDYFEGFEKIGPKKAFLICKDFNTFNNFMRLQNEKTLEMYNKALVQFK
jgi:exonuclease-1